MKKHAYTRQSIYLKNGGVIAAIIHYFRCKIVAETRNDQPFTTKG